MSYNPRYYAFLDPVTLDKIHLGYKVNTGLIGCTDRVTILDDETIDALAQFEEAMSCVDTRSIPAGIQILEARNLGRFSEFMNMVDTLGAFMGESDPALMHNDLVYLVDKLLNETDTIEKDLPTIRKNLTDLKAHLERSPNYNPEILQEIHEWRSTHTGDCNCFD